MILLALRIIPDPIPPRLLSETAHAFLFSFLQNKNIPLPEGAQIIKAPGGRPFLAHPDNSPIKGLDFNLSHTDRFIALAVSASEHTAPPHVGVDIEIPHPRVSPEKIARRFFTENEQAALFTSPDPPKTFLSLWTRKEALLKYRGTGLSGGMQSVDVLSPNALPDRIAFHSYALEDYPSASLTLCIPLDLPRPPLEIFLG